MYIADLHIHSRYSRATSRDCDLPHLDQSARQKGISLIGTGDFTHPAWRKELAEALTPAEEGLYTLCPEYRLQGETSGEAPRFVASGEISSIYKKNGRVRKVHNVILLPSLEAAEELSRKLEAIGNIHSDGRPILGLDSRDLLEITLDTCPEALFIPAHIWTPHFSMFGAFSGFDTIEECFEDLTPYIYAAETGLSSDPPMNWRVSALDALTLLSSSDAHSPGKLGREANMLEGTLSYPALVHAIRTGEGFGGTIEFFPEEGKYHLDGHRNCHVCLQPAETIQFGGKCPVCGRKITIGVQHRVEELADRPEGFRPEHAKPYESLVPLPEVVAASTGMSVTGKKTDALYRHLLKELGPEFDILRQADIADIETVAGPAVAEGIRRLRAGQVERVPGYDGEYGTISLFDPAELEDLNGQTSLFGSPIRRTIRKKAAAPLQKAPKPADLAEEKDTPANNDPLAGLNAEQLQAVTSDQPAIAVCAGPGTGKTKTLVSRIAYLIESCQVKPAQITAVTFTRQAAAEMRERLEARLGGKRALRGMTIGTFHAICLQMLGNVSIVSAEDAVEIASETLQAFDVRQTPQSFLRAVSKVKNGFSFVEADISEELFSDYNRRLHAMQVRDFDDLLTDALALPADQRRGFDYLLVDEFQDINPAQYALVRAWSQDGKGLFVIGDPDQSIYGFRGADAHCFARLAEDFQNLYQNSLTQNYRSAPEILTCALSSISKNGGEERRLTANSPSGMPVRLIRTESEFAEAVFVAKEVTRMTGGIDMLDAEQGTASERSVFRSFSDIAVLCRTHRQADLIEKCLRHESIPCIISGREHFLSEDSVRGVLGFFRSLLDPTDTVSLRACLRLVWGCPADLIARASDFSRRPDALQQGMLSLEAASEELGSFGFLAQWLQDLAVFQPKAAREKPRKLLEEWGKLHGITPAFEQLMHMAVFHTSLPDFLQALTIGEEPDLQRASGKSYAAGAVRVMTLHGAKGLEFPAVFLFGLTAGSLPLESPHYVTDLDEERRLFYVGMTRAREELILTTAEAPSVFLEELPQDVLQTTTAARRFSSSGVQLRLF